MEITVGIDFCDDGLEQFSVDTVAHDGEDGLHHGRRNAAFLVVIEAVEHFAQHELLFLVEVLHVGSAVWVVKK